MQEVLGDFFVNLYQNGGDIYTGVEVGWAGLALYCTYLPFVFEFYRRVQQLHKLFVVEKQAEFVERKNDVVQEISDIVQANDRTQEMQERLMERVKECKKLTGLVNEFENRYHQLVAEERQLSAFKIKMLSLAKKATPIVLAVAGLGYWVGKAVYNTAKTFIDKV